MRVLTPREETDATLLGQAPALDKAVQGLIEANVREIVGAAGGMTVKTALKEVARVFQETRGSQV